MTRYMQRKLSGVCVRSGCSTPAQDDHLLCERHAQDHRARNRKSMKRTRRSKRVQEVLPWMR